MVFLGRTRSKNTVSTRNLSGIHHFHWMFCHSTTCLKPHSSDSDCLFALLLLFVSDHTEAAGSWHFSHLDDVHVSVAVSLWWGGHIRDPDQKNRPSRAISRRFLISPGAFRRAAGSRAASSASERRRWLGGFLWWN